MEGQLSDFSNVLKEGNEEELISSSKQPELFETPLLICKEHYSKDFDIVVDVEDRPGIIATIATALARKGINIKNIELYTAVRTRKVRWRSVLKMQEAMNAGLKTLIALGYHAKAEVGSQVFRIKQDVRGHIVPLALSDF